MKDGINNPTRGCFSSESIVLMVAHLDVLHAQARDVRLNCELLLVVVNVHWRQARGRGRQGWQA